MSGTYGAAASSGTAGSERHTAGRPDDSDERNHLFEGFIDWVNLLKPKATLFENVRGTQKTDGEFFDAV